MCAVGRAGEKVAALRTSLVMHEVILETINNPMYHEDVFRDDVSVHPFCTKTFPCVGYAH